MARQQSARDPSGYPTDGGTYARPGPVPIPPEPLRPEQLLVQMLVGGALMLVLLSINAYLLGYGGLFPALFTLYTMWAGYSLWKAFIRRPRA